MIRIVIISDTHSLHHGLKKFGNMPDGDILIHAGDVSNVGDIHDIERFMKWFAKQPYEEKIFIAGNHDFGFETHRGIVINIYNEINEKYHNITYLEDDGIEIMGLKFWGSPVTSPFMNWAFNHDDETRAKHWEMIDVDTDILITHGPPFDILDFSVYGYEHTGCKFLRNKVFEIKPILHAFGHIHHDYGYKKENDILFINASTLNERYHVTNKPIVVDIDLENRTASIVN